MPVPVIINDREFIRPGDPADILNQFAFKSKGIHQKKAVKPVNVDSLPKELASCEYDLKMPGFDKIRSLEFVISFYFDSRREEFLASIFKEKFNGREVVKDTIEGVNRYNLN